MSKKSLYIACVLMALATTGVRAQTATEAVHTESGKAVRRITFDREQVTIVYADGTTESGVSKATVRLGQINETTGVQTPATTQQQAATVVYDLQGRRVNPTAHQSGVFIERNGNQVRRIIKK
ncbi:MAG: hypothetical protein J6M53_00035 [Bacteroidaceae bacterium]|nr:hypothetical protein [Bacteroidaceae bacterium]